MSVLSKEAEVKKKIKKLLKMLTCSAGSREKEFTVGKCDRACK